MSLFPFQVSSLSCVLLVFPKFLSTCWLVWMQLACWEFVQGKAPLLFCFFCSCLRENTKKPIGDCGEGLGCWHRRYGSFLSCGSFSPRGLLLSPDPGGWGAGLRLTAHAWESSFRRRARESLVFSRIEFPQPPRQAGLCSQALKPLAKPPQKTGLLPRVLTASGTALQ